MNIKEKIKLYLFKAHWYKTATLFNKGYIVNYHKVANSPNPFYPEISTEVFEKQIRHLAQNYQVISLDELVDRIKYKKSLRRLVAITFDDGFRDNYTHAYPILKKYNVPATIFLISGCIETGEAPWFIKFRHAFATTPKKHIKIVLGDTKLDLPLYNLDNRHKSSEQAMACLQSCPNKERIKYLAIIYDALEFADSDLFPDMMLTWDQVKEMAQNSISFGAHTHTHPVLYCLSLTEAEQEIKTSKDIIEANLGTKVNGFAYPVGKQAHYNKELFPILKREEFKFAVTTSTEKISYNSNLYELSRPYPWEINMFN